LWPRTPTLAAKTRVVIDEIVKNANMQTYKLR